MNRTAKPNFNALYLTVLPFYRQSCIESLLDQAGVPVQIYAGPRQLTASVKTGIGADLYHPLRAHFLLNRAIVLSGNWKSALSAESLMLDLNPRCITAWAMLVARRILGRRTIVWGHLFPRAGAGAWTARLRRSMRRLAHGTVLYGFDSVVPARAELPRQPVWVAPNSLYASADLHRSSGSNKASSIVYVGRLVDEKKVDLLVKAFCHVAEQLNGVNLKIVGQGSAMTSLQTLAKQLGCVDRVEFLGSITDTDELRSVYSDALCSVSPGYVGLSLTQSLGFGVPMLIADDEPHAPEVELEKFGGVARFKEDDHESLAALLVAVFSGDRAFPQPDELSAPIRDNYSAESMARGLLDSLEGTNQNLGASGWPQ